MEQPCQIRWTPEAVDDLASLRAFIAARDPFAARDVLARIIEAVSRLAEYPGLGRAGRVPATRELVVARTPCFVVYRMAEQVVRIERVLHGAQEWPQR